MTASVFDDPWLCGLFGDGEIAAIWSHERRRSHMLAFEAAWARALGACGLADAGTAERAAAAILAAHVDDGDIRAGTAVDGVPVLALVRALKAVAGETAVHTGSTSQDVIDTALALTLKETSALIAARISTLSDALAGLESRFGGNRLMGRTRMQVATEITAADRIAAWREPLADHAERLAALRPRVERVQVGGAAGDRKALGDKAQAVTDHVALSLGLHPTARSWQARRDGIAEYAGFLSLVSGTLGKIGQDIALMAQQGIGEIALSGGGGSSAMPHKQNPVLAELLVTLARFNAVQVSGMHQAMVHEQERSGAAWSLEWMILPQMAAATARSLSAGLAVTAGVERMGTV
ncbi:3-carboxy-cis,cis-muconate cycloisomerase [Martelella soudanensis]|uniref:3-carboxy-cis,cis-muconate cycloisomerase n=1 Tax=unclassified Martelella TaxID=2629616 RepID=UPI0015DEDCDB|nr:MULTISPECIES: 3-carboxy-cis,cis-muconate cycloisomerase [unclassified Martelella]